VSWCSYGVLRWAVEPLVLEKGSLDDGYCWSLMSLEVFEYVFVVSFPVKFGRQVVVGGLFLLRDRIIGLWSEEMWWNGERYISSTECVFSLMNMWLMAVFYGDPLLSWHFWRSALRRSGGTR
jgi:hypothetical protein